MSLKELETAYAAAEKESLEAIHAEEKLQIKRDHVWKLLGSPSLGFVGFGGLKFSRAMLLVGAGFFALFFGSLIFTPFVGILLGVVALAVGRFWIKHAK